MRKIFPYFLLAIIFITFNFNASCLNLENSDELSIISWNLKDFGQSRDDSEILLIAEELKDADIVALQEIVAKHPGGAKAVARLADELNRKGNKWDYRVSNPTQSTSAYKTERYAFLWKTSKVSLTGGRPFLISDLSSVVEREPYAIQFRIKNETITILNYHACTHKKDYPERKEIQAISSWLIRQSYDNVVWVGDMNLVIDDFAFETIKSFGFGSALNGEKTSLKKKCENGKYLSRAEDNILYKFLGLKYKGSEVIDFIRNGDCGHLNWKRDSYSDHLGVEVIIGI